uniref:Uncharacterized protein n=1 Tax=Rhizophora mucronata TaxID=61149 RepID=A0A2P2QX72_RHIMU
MNAFFVHERTFERKSASSCYGGCFTKLEIANATCAYVICGFVCLASNYVMLLVQNFQQHHASCFSMLSTYFSLP